MSLQYNILWVDDRKEDYQILDMDKDIESYVRELFFIPHIDFFDNVEEAVKSARSKKYDVIFSDYNIEEQKDGQAFITEIRNNNVKAEVLFYSALHEPPAKGWDRISFLRLQSADAYEDLKAKMKSVIDLTIEKLNDLTNLRGLVMAEVSELDNLMEDIIREFYSKKKLDSVEWCDFKNKIIKEVQKSTLKKIQNGKVDIVKKDGRKKEINVEKGDCPKNCTHLWMDAKNIDEIISNFEFDSSKKAHTINEILRKVTISKKFVFKDYDENIIKVRNDLAHSRSIMKKGQEILATKKKGEKSFTESDLIIIRKNIVKYHELFEELLEVVKTA